MIITADNIREIRDVSTMINDEKRISVYIQEAESIDVAPFIGVDVYQGIDENPQDNQTILNGGYYDRDGETFKMDGLIKVISYFAYARLIRGNSTNVTAFGVVSKNSQYSDNQSVKAINAQAENAENIGRKMLNDTIKYLRCTTGTNKRAIKSNKWKVI